MGRRFLLTIWLDGSAHDGHEFLVEGFAVYEGHGF